MRIDRTSTPVIILRLDHYGALGIMRSLGRLGIATCGVHRDADAPALRSRYCRRGLLWDLDGEPADRSVEFLLGSAAPLGDRPILLPSNDETALFVAENADRLRPAFRFQENDAALVRSLYKKMCMHQLACSHGLPTAATVFPGDRDDVVAFCRTARFPVMLKGSDGIALSHRAGLKMVLARSAAELIEWYDRIEDPARPDLMLQEYIPGGEDCQWMWNGYFDASSDCLFGITGRKLRQTPVYTGMTSLGECAPNEEVDALTRAFVKAIGYRGILDIGYRFDARDGRYKVLDVNPRIGATFRLFVGEDGMDVARALYLDLTGQRVPTSVAPRGRRWFVEDLDLLSSVRYWRDGVLGVGEWLRSFAGVREAAWFAADDPAPLAAVCGGRLAGVARRLGLAGATVASPRATARAERHQAEVGRYFGSAARYWKSIYEDRRLTPLLYRERHETALRWIDEIALEPGARVLEVGCGSGHTAVALARRGHPVHAVDSTPEMIALTDEAAKAAGVRLTTMVADAHELDLPARSFDLVIALGVLPWLHSPERALSAMARVVRPGGHLLVTADNLARLDRLIDPRSTPLLAPARAAIKRALSLSGAPLPIEELQVRRHSAAHVDRLLRATGFRKLRSATLGFGPFTLLGRPVLSDEAGVRLHGRLQRLADAGWPLLRHAGVHYLVLAARSAD
jgi:predicted ATP-grasp superfamily ATP-dependent carboligase/2-polyprenyl-3-methyl-5-hydroxy-6-metoxy-1,4-benzoquinol methylase